MTTILCVRKGNEVVMAGDGQATLGESIVFKSKSVKVRRIGNGKIIAGFAGAAAGVVFCSLMFLLSFFVY